MYTIIHKQEKIAQVKYNYIKIMNIKNYENNYEYKKL